MFALSMFNIFGTILIMNYDVINDYKLQSIICTKRKLNKKCCQWYFENILQTVTLKHNPNIFIIRITWSN